VTVARCDSLCGRAYVTAGGGSGNLAGEVWSQLCGGGARGGRAPRGEQSSSILVCMRERERFVNVAVCRGWRPLDKDEANNLRQLAYIL
jgi:hypothetical protein